MSWVGFPVAGFPACWLAGWFGIWSVACRLTSLACFAGRLLVVCGFPDEARDSERALGNKGLRMSHDVGLRHGLGVGLGICHCPTSGSDDIVDSL